MQGPEAEDCLWYVFEDHHYLFIKPQCLEPQAYQAESERKAAIEPLFKAHSARYLRENIENFTKHTEMPSAEFSMPTSDVLSRDSDGTDAFGNLFTAGFDKLNCACTKSNPNPSGYDRIEASPGNLDFHFVPTEPPTGQRLNREWSQQLLQVIDEAVCMLNKRIELENTDEIAEDILSPPRNKRARRDEGQPWALAEWNLEKHHRGAEYSIDFLSCSVALSCVLVLANQPGKTLLEYGTCLWLTSSTRTISSRPLIEAFSTFYTSQGR